MIMKKYIALGVLVACADALAILLVTGCTTVDVNTVIDALTNVPPSVVTNVIPVVTNVVPVVDNKPVSCGCDLSKPATVFASPVHGADESAVGAWLRQRWVDGKRDSCDGLPRDVRPQALNPSGKGPFNWKYAITDGKVGIRFEGNNMAVTCGDVIVDGQTQRWHIVGCTNTEEGRKAADWTPMTPGVMTTKKHFVCFEIR
jgi:hypothetical protein